MRLICLILIGMVLGGCLHAPADKAITLVDSGCAGPELMERLRRFMEKELRVPVRTVDAAKLSGKKDFAALEKAARKIKHENDIAYIVIAQLDEESHLEVYEETGVAVINAQALHTDDAEKYALRIQRMAMRAAAFVFGLSPTPDPFCVTRNYRSLEDLDRMGRNYSPPWQARYAEEAAKRGLQPIQPTHPKPPALGGGVLK